MRWSRRDLWNAGNGSSAGRDERPFDFHVYGAARLLICLSLGIGLAWRSSPLSFHIYIKHGFPLLAAPLYLAKGLLFVALSWITCFLVAQLRVRVPSSLIAGVMASLLLFESAWISVRNVRDLHPIPTGWVQAVRDLQGASFAVSWIPNSVSVWTHQWTIGVRPGYEREIALRLRRGEAPFQPQDLFLFGERDAQAKMSDYLRPRYWLYFPVDQNTPFDHPNPECRHDWLVTLALTLRTPRAELPALDIHGIQLRREQDSVLLRLWGKFQRSNVAPTSVRLEYTPAVPAVGLPAAAPATIDSESVVNCIYRSFELYARVSAASVKDGRLRLTALLEDGRRLAGPELRLSTAGELPAEYRFRAPQMSSEALVEKLSNVPRAAQGPGYVIFDLGNAYPQSGK